MTGLPNNFRAADVQGNILRGYGRARVRHLLLEVADAPAARRWLAAAAAGGDAAVPAVTTEEQWEIKPATCFNLGLTFAGMTALGLPAATLAGFPSEFRGGMASRAVKLGDVGASAPDRWPAPFDAPGRLHIVAAIHGAEPGDLARVEAMIPAGPGAAFVRLGARDGWNFDGDVVHFGYRDNFSQPRFAGIHDPGAFPDKQPLAPVGSMLLGYATEYEGLLWTIPQPDVFGRNGAFNAFRVLAQDVTAFEAYLDSAAAAILADPLGDDLLPPGAKRGFGAGLSRHAALREVVAAKMCGRWRNGVPLALSPDTPDPATPPSLTDFDYSGGTACPFGAHMRRVNPRGGTIVQRAARHTRRLVRRSHPYGPAYDPSHPATERGLLGNFIGANLGAQFEALMCDWVNLGLEDPRITGTNDALIGNNIPAFSAFTIPLASGGVIRLEGFPRFVTTRGGAYTFLPGLPALRYLATL